MKLSVLEFRIADEVFCFNTEIVDYVFELEGYTKLDGLHHAVIGMKKHNQDVVPLIDTRQLYEQKKLDYSTSKSVIVIHNKKSEQYGMVVDEILKIETLEKVASKMQLNVQDTVINHYKDEEKIVNEIVPLPLLQKNNIVAMKKPSKLQKDDLLVEEHRNENYLLFRIEESFYGIESKFVKEVIENEAQTFRLSDEDLYGAIAVREEVVSAVRLQEPSYTDSIIILEKDFKKIAILVDEVFDIESFDTTKIESVKSQKSIKAFYNFDSKIVALVNIDFYLDKVDKNENTEIENTAHKTKNEFLTFYLGDERFAIDMQVIRHVTDSESLVKTEASSIAENNKYVKFLASWNDKAINVLDISDLLGVTLSNDEESQVIFIENNGSFIGFMVDDVEDIVYLNDEEIIDAKNHNTIVDGAMVIDDEAIVKINEDYILYLI